MPAINRILTIEQGASWEEALPAVDAAGEPLDLTGYTPRMQIRLAPMGAIIAEPELSVPDPQAGVIVARLPASMTEDLVWRRGLYDLEVAAEDGTVLRLFAGEVRISPEITA